MKKLLVLLTVMAIASTASAALEVVAPAQMLWNTTESISIDVVGSEVATIGDMLVISAEPGGAFGSVDTSQKVFATMTDVVPSLDDFSSDADLQAMAVSLGFANPVGIFYYTFVQVSGNPSSLENTSLLSNILLTAGGTNGILDIGIIDGVTGAVKDTKLVEVVPEPMTIALLGLGGLFLRRRK